MSAKRPLRATQRVLQPVARLVVADALPGAVVAPGRHPVAALALEAVWDGLMARLRQRLAQQEPRA